MLTNLAKGVAALMLSSLLMLVYIAVLGMGVALCWYGFYLQGLPIVSA